MWQGRSGLSRQRVLRGYLVAAYALRIAGVPFTECCFVIGVSPKRARQYMKASYCQGDTRRTRWSGQRLEQVAKAYADHTIEVRRICEVYRITQASLYKLAQLHGWRGRPMGPRPKALASRNLSGPTLAYYKRLRAGGLSIEDALAAVQRGAEPIHSADTAPQTSAPPVVTHGRARSNLPHTDATARTP